MITIYTITYNEELLIQFMIDHYRTRFPGCRIVVYDNMSTDNTVKIALANDCEVIPYDTNGQLQDNRYIKIKNHCWKDAKTDWVLVCDLDELLDINAKQLKTEEDAGTTIVKTKGYDMVTLEDKLDLAGMKYGERDEGEDKSILFNKKFVEQINYDIGCHICSPIGKITYSKKVYKLFHYCYINCKLTVEKYKLYTKRISPENIKYHWGGWESTPEEIHALYDDAWSKAIKVR